MQGAAAGGLVQLMTGHHATTSTGCEPDASSRLAVGLTVGIGWNIAPAHDDPSCWGGRTHTEIALMGGWTAGWLPGDTQWTGGKGRLFCLYSRCAAEAEKGRSER